LSFVVFNRRRHHHLNCRGHDRERQRLGVDGLRERGHCRDRGRELAAENRHVRVRAYVGDHECERASAYAYECVNDANLYVHVRARVSPCVHVGAGDYGRAHARALVYVHDQDVLL